MNAEQVVLNLGKQGELNRQAPLAFTNLRNGLLGKMRSRRQIRTFCHAERSLRTLTKSCCIGEHSWIRGMFNCIAGISAITLDKPRSATSLEPHVARTLNASHAPKLEEKLRDILGQQSTLHRTLLSVQATKVEDSTQIGVTGISPFQKA
jgi:hypothetical protein